jgi:hypothetical protein
MSSFEFSIPEHNQPTLAAAIAVLRNATSDNPLPIRDVILGADVVGVISSLALICNNALRVATDGEADDLLWYLDLKAAGLAT